MVTLLILISKPALVIPVQDQSIKLQVTEKLMSQILNSEINSEDCRVLEQNSKFCSAASKSKSDEDEASVKLDTKMSSATKLVAVDFTVFGKVQGTVYT